MNEVDLKQRAAELEQTLQLQLAQLKKDSEIWIKTGGAVLAIGLIASAVIKGSKKKRNKKRLSVSNISHGSRQQVHKVNPKSSSFFSPLKKRLFLALFSLGQAKVMEEIKKRKNIWDEK